VTCVSWEDADAFCKWLSQKEGKTYRLPTDHEWSIAVGIGGSEEPSASPRDKSGKIEGVYPWGEDFPPTNVQGNYGLKDEFPRTAPVMSFAPNKLGVFDLGGNVSEWCQDRYTGTHRNPVIRGCSWYESRTTLLLSSARSNAPPGLRNSHIGFRCVLAVSTVIVGSTSDQASLARRSVPQPEAVDSSKPLAASGGIGGTPADMPTSAPIPAPSVDPRLTQLEAGFQSRYANDAQKPFETALASLNHSYIVHGIAAARAAAQSKGDRGEIAALNDEQATLQTGARVPAEDTPGIPESLKNLRATYRTSLRRLEADRANKAAPLYDLYLSALQAHIIELTKEGKTAEAQKVETLQKQVAATRQELVLEPGSPSAVGRSGAPAPATLGGIGASPSSGAPYVNSLGMRFVPVTGTKVLFCIHETRVADFAAFVAGSADYDYNRDGAPWTSGTDGMKKRSGYSWRTPTFAQTEEHPVTCVNVRDAEAFCQWLSQKESKAYRLPTDHEWSEAVGIGSKESANAMPKDKDQKIIDIYPWGRSFPPTGLSGNYRGEESKTGKEPVPWTVISGFRDDFARTAPVGSFAPNRFGLYDLGGNVAEWMSDRYEADQKYGVVRGASWNEYRSPFLLSSDRTRVLPVARGEYVGFRCVLVPGS
jgi:formylglycine-generating enzyme required for sulfatase activity